MEKDFVLIESQGRLLRMSWGAGGSNGNVEPTLQNKRSTVNEFSAASRLRLLRKLSTLELNQDLAFLTLTFPDQYPDAQTAKRHLRNYIKRLKRMIPELGVIWKMELQQRGAPHFHLLMANWVFIEQAVLLEMWRRVTQMDVRHLHIEFVRGDAQLALKYMAKYVGKAGNSLANDAYLSVWGSNKFGRWWGSNDIEQFRHAPAQLVLLSFNPVERALFVDATTKYLRLRANVQSDYTPQISASFFTEDNAMGDMPSELDTIFNNITPYSSFYDFLSDTLWIDDPTYSIAQNRVYYVDMIALSEIPF